jgi:hypothetical protein
MIPLSGTDSGNRLGVEGSFEGVSSPPFPGLCWTIIGSSDISATSDER